MLGALFSFDLLCEVSGLGRGDALEAIEELLAARLLLEDESSVDRFGFPHVLIRNAVYAGIDGEQRCRLHLRTATALESLLESSLHSAADIAYHFIEASTTCPATTAAAWAERAGSEASRRFAFAEAVEWHERAIASWAEAGTWVSGRTYLELARACDGARQFSRAHEAYLLAAARSRDAGDAELLADVAIAAAPAWTADGASQPETQRLVEDALERLGASDPRRRIQLLSRLATLLHYADPERQRLLVQESCNLAQGDVDGTSIAVASLSRHLWLWHSPAARRERLDLARNTFVVACQRSNATTQLRAERELLADLLENGDVDGFDRQLDEYEARAKDGASARDIYWSMALRATQATLRGDLSFAEQLARGARIRGRDLYQEALGAEMLQRFVLRYQQGRLSELVSGLRQMTEIAPAYRAGSALAATACVETGRVAEGARRARWALGRDGTEMPKDVLWLGAHALLCGVAARAKDVDLARQLDELVAPCGDHVVIFGAGGAVLGSVHYWRGLVAAALSDFDRAADHLGAAIDASERMRAPFWTAQARIELATVLARRGAAASRPAIRELTERADRDRAAERLRPDPRPGADADLSPDPALVAGLPAVCAFTVSPHRGIEPRRAGVGMTSRQRRVPPDPARGLGRRPLPPHAPGAGRTCGRGRSGLRSGGARAAVRRVREGVLPATRHQLRRVAGRRRGPRRPRPRRHPRRGEAPPPARTPAAARRGKRRTAFRVDALAAGSRSRPAPLPPSVAVPFTGHPPNVGPRRGPTFASGVASLAALGVQPPASMS